MVNQVREAELFWRIGRAAGFFKQKESCRRDEESVQPAGRLSHPSHFKHPLHDIGCSRCRSRTQNNPCYVLKTPLVHDCTLRNNIRALCIQNISAKRTIQKATVGFRRRRRNCKPEQCSSPESQLIAHTAKTWQLLIKVLHGSGGSMRRTCVDRWAPG